MGLFMNIINLSESKREENVIMFVSVSLFENGTMNAG